jgi:hypothetical protein
MPVLQKRSGSRDDLDTKAQHSSSRPLRRIRCAFQRTGQGATEVDQVSARNRPSPLNTGGWHVAPTRPCPAALMERIRFHAVLLTLTYALAGSADAAPRPDAQGWNGPGWYITGSAPPASLPAAAPDYILFEGPHALAGECLDIYNRLYSPVGICRFLDAKPVAFAGLKPSA